jgi:hypothetical protein
LGWFIFADTSMGKIVWHGGGQPGAVAIYLRNITKKQVVVVLDNHFSEGIYGNGLNALRLMNKQPAIVRKKSLVVDYGASLMRDGAAVAFSRLMQLRADAANYYLREEQMNQLGYQLLDEADFAGHQLLALEVLKLNVLLFPESSNVYDSYAEALAKIGHQQQADWFYKKASELK